MAKVIPSSTFPRKFWGSRLTDRGVSCGCICAICTYVWSWSSGPSPNRLNGVQCDCWVAKKKVRLFENFATSGRLQPVCNSASETSVLKTSFGSCADAISKLQQQRYSWRVSKSLYCDDPFELSDHRASLRSSTFSTNDKSKTPSKTKY